MIDSPGWLLLAIAIIIVGLVGVGPIVVDSWQLNTTDHRNTLSEPPLDQHQFTQGIADGLNKTYNPQPGIGLPDYKDGYKLGYTVAHCSCNCTGGSP